MSIDSFLTMYTDRILSKLDFPPVSVCGIDMLFHLKGNRNAYLIF